MLRQADIQIDRLSAPLARLGEASRVAVGRLEVRREPADMRALVPENVLGKSVAIACAAISTARAPSACSRTKRSLATTAAAAPLDVGQLWSNVRGG